MSPLDLRGECQDNVGCLALAQGRGNIVACASKFDYVFLVLLNHCDCVPDKDRVGLDVASFSVQCRLPSPASTL